MRGRKPPVTLTPDERADLARLVAVDRGVTDVKRSASFVEADLRRALRRHKFLAAQYAAEQNAARQNIADGIFAGVRSSWDDVIELRRELAGCF